MKETRNTKIYQHIYEATEKINWDKIEQSLSNCQIKNIQASTGISNNNISMELNRLFAGAKLLRIRGRPITYLSVECLEKKLGYKLEQHEFSSLDEFLKTIYPSKFNKNTKEILHADCASDFDLLIGSNKSLRAHIEQAKAAILYPPHGLDTLLTGATGVGKSHFAHCMFDFAKKSGRLKKSSSLITYNCANYAENPQLVMSQLFGHSKGSFTGAISDQAGLVELADQGILFLDEIHRLNPEGQEKLFLLMDKGIFCRLGETQTTRHADVLLICATSEAPQDSMLSTFLRRIPVHIKLPSLAERSVLERLLLVLFFFWKEAVTLKKEIQIDQKIIITFVHYDCPNNIGQLSTDIKLTCANAYYKHLLENKDYLYIEFGNLNPHIALSLFTAGGNSKILSQFLKDGPIIISQNDSLQDCYRKYLYIEDTRI